MCVDVGGGGGTGTFFPTSSTDTTKGPCDQKFLLVVAAPTLQQERQTSPSLERMRLAWVKDISFLARNILTDLLGFVGVSLSVKMYSRSGPSEARECVLYLLYCCSMPHVRNCESSFLQPN